MAEEKSNSGELHVPFLREDPADLFDFEPTVAVIRQGGETTAKEESNSGESSVSKIYEASGDFFNFFQKVPIVEKSKKSLVVKESIEEAAKKYGVPAGKKARETAKKAMMANKELTAFGVGASTAQVYNSINEMVEAYNSDSMSNEEKILAMISGGGYAIEGGASGVEGILYLINKQGKLSSKLGKLAPGAEILGGTALTIKSIVELSGEQSESERLSSICNLTSGILDVGSGGFDFIKALGPISIPMGTLSSFFSMAGDAFGEGNKTLGYIYIILGDALTAILLIPTKALMTTALTSFTSLSASTAATLATTVIGAVAGFAVLATIAVIIADALTSEPQLAQGGFLSTGQAFIAREAGPELVGTIHGRNAVVNRNQIVEAVSNGVSRAVSSAIGGELTGGPVHARLCIDGKQVSIA